MCSIAIVAFLPIGESSLHNCAFPLLISYKLNKYNKLIFGLPACSLACLLASISFCFCAPKHKFRTCCLHSCRAKKIIMEPGASEEASIQAPWRSSLLVQDGAHNFQIGYFVYKSKSIAKKQARDDMKYAFLMQCISNGIWIQKHWNIQHL